MMEEEEEGETEEGTNDEADDGDEEPEVEKEGTITGLVMFDVVVVAFVVVVPLYPTGIESGSTGTKPLGSGDEAGGLVFPTSSCNDCCELKLGWPPPSSILRRLKKPVE
jgi:hypothetical protein